MNRYRPEIQWSYNSWTHNVFRLYELIFGRKEGVRREMSYDSATNTYFCHTWESVFALTEQYIREFFSSWKLAPFKIYVPMLMTTSGVPVFASPYLLAVARDNSVFSTPSAFVNTFTTPSFTCTGSNLVLFANLYVLTETLDVLTSASYNAVSMFPALASLLNVGDGGFLYMTTLANPATGGHTFTMTTSATKNYAIVLVSYSGVSQSPLTNFATQYTTPATTSWSQSLTTVHDNSWVMAAIADGFGGTSTAGAGTTLIQAGNGSGEYAGDSNAAIHPVGSYTLNVSSFGGISKTIASIMIEIPIFTGGGGTAIPFKSLLGVGI